MAAACYLLPEVFGLLVQAGLGALSLGVLAMKKRWDSRPWSTFLLCFPFLYNAAPQSHKYIFL